MLGKVEVLLSDENALCGDRVSACPCMQQSREKYIRVCHSHGSRVGRILTSEEVPRDNMLAMINYSFCNGELEEMAHVQVVEFLIVKLDISTEARVEELRRTNSWIFLRSSLGISILTA